MIKREEEEICKKQKKDQSCTRPNWIKPVTQNASEHKNVRLKPLTQRCITCKSEENSIRYLSLMGTHGQFQNPCCASATLSSQCLKLKQPYPYRINLAFYFYVRNQQTLSNVILEMFNRKEIYLQGQSGAPNVSLCSANPCQ